MSRGIYCKLRSFLLFKYGISVAFSVLNYGSRDSIKLQCLSQSNWIGNT